MRLFVAVPLSPELAHRTASFVDTLRSRVVRLAPHTRLSWVPPERLHITLAFIGDVPEARVPAIQAALEPQTTVGPFQLKLAGAGAFPSRGRPRVLWVGVHEGRESLMAVAGDVRTRLEAAGVLLETRPFSPHMTVARVKEPAGLRPAALLEGLADGPIGGMTVDAITLFQSRLSPSGPSYHVITRSLLSGTAPS